MMYEVREDYFDNIDTEAKAYFLGFLYADGYNGYNPEKHRHTIGIGISEIDKEIVEKFRKEIYLNNDKPFYYGKGGASKGVKYRKPQIILNIGNKRLSTRLNEIGCTKNKTETLVYPSIIEEKYTNHFIRGYFDGDGCIGLYSNADRKSKQASFSLASTFNFNNIVKNILEEETKANLQIKRLSKESLTNVCVLYSGGNRQVKKIMDYLYQDATIFLGRKYNKYQELNTILNLWDNDIRKCDFCDSKHFSKGMCKKHYKRNYRGKFSI
jgi:hypothetical protein